MNAISSMTKDCQPLAVERYAVYLHESDKQSARGNKLQWIERNVDEEVDPPYCGIICTG